jgi:hypothetical protein
MAVGAQEHLAGNREALQVNLVADPVARLGVVDLEVGAGGLEKAVIFGVLGAHPQGVVVDVADGELAPQPGRTQLAQVQKDHGPGTVLGEHLVCPDPHLLPRPDDPGDQMVLQDLVDGG